jgi:hypothetical protein
MDADDTDQQRSPTSRVIAEIGKGKTLLAIMHDIDQQRSPELP